MARGILLGGGVVSAVMTALAQDDFRFGQGLANRGFGDLAAEVFEKAGGTGGRATEAQLYLMRNTLTELEKTMDKKERLARAGPLVKRVQEFIDANANAPFIVEAYRLFADIQRMVARTHMSLRDPDKADAAFQVAIQAWDKIAKDLRAKRKSVPQDDPELGQKADEQILEAEYGYIAEQYFRINTLAEDPSRRDLVEKEIATLSKYFEEFMWNWDGAGYLLPLVASTEMGRAWAVVARMRGEARDWTGERMAWEQCLRWIGKGKAPAQNVKYRSDPSVREVYLRTVEFEMAARNGYGAMLLSRGGNFKMQFEAVLNLMKEAYQLYPDIRGTEKGIAISLEGITAMMRLGKRVEAEAIARDLLNHKDPRIRDRAEARLGDLPGLMTVQAAFDSAEGAFNRNNFFSAVRRYQDVLELISRPEDQAYKAKCWAKIGECYHATGRYFEAIAAFQEVLKLKGNADEASLKATVGTLMRSIGALLKILKDPSLEALKTEVEGMASGMGLLDTMTRRNKVIDLERDGKWAEAKSGWQQIAQDPKSTEDSKAEALARIGYCTWKEVEAIAAEAPEKYDSEAAKTKMKDAVQAFEAHLQFVKGLPAIKPDLVLDVVHSLYFGSVAYAKLKDPEKVLEISKEFLPKFESWKPELTTKILAHRIDAHLSRGDMFAAEAEFRILDGIYKRTNAGLGEVKRGLTGLAMMFDELSRRAETEDERLALSDKAALYEERLMELPGAGGEGEKDFDRLQRMALAQFRVAEKKKETDPDDALKRFAKAREFFQKLLSDFQDRIRADEDPLLAYKFRFRIIKCLLAEGKVKEASEKIDAEREMIKQDPELRELQGDVLVTMAKQAAGNEKVALYKRAADECFGPLAAKFIPFVGTKDEREKMYFKYAYRWCETLAQFSEGAQRFADYYMNMERRKIAPEWDGGEYQKKFEALKQETIRKYGAALFQGGK